MPLALVSDIHGNDDALAAVVADLGRLGVERVICLGDAVQGGPQPREVLERLASLGWPTIQSTRTLDGALYVDPGSVGLAYDRFDEEPVPASVEYALVTGGSVEFRRVPWQTAS